MNETIVEWLICFSFFLLVAAFTLLEALWIKRQGWASFGKAIGFSLVSNIVGYTIGFVVMFVAFMAILMVTFEPPKNGAVTSAIDAVGMGIAALVIPVLLILFKRILLYLFKIRFGAAAWLYSIIVPVVMFIVTFGVPSLLAYTFYRSSK